MKEKNTLATFWIEIALETPSIYHLFFIMGDKLPMQEVPSPENPTLHSQIYEPIEFIHFAFVSHGLEVHSLMSKI